MREKIQRFMQGRYGVDHLNRFMMVCGMVCLVISMIFGFRIFYYVALFSLIFTYYRMLSRNFAKRSRENAKFLELKRRVTGKFPALKTRDANYRIFRCPGCRQKVRVPRGRGRISITCPKCRREFIKKT